MLRPILNLLGPVLGVLRPILALECQQYKNMLKSQKVFEKKKSLKISK